MPFIALLVVLAIVTVEAPGLTAQAQPTGPGVCTCVADVDTLVAKLKRNYIAYQLEVAGQAREREFHQLAAEVRQAAFAASEDACIGQARRLTDWFRDGHLFIFEQPEVGPEEAARLAAATPVRVLREEEVRADLTTRPRPLDPIEGVWYAPGYRMAVVPAGRPGEFEGVVLSTEHPTWRPGQVKARFVREGDGGYRTWMRADNHSPRHVVARLYRNGQLLTTSPVVWGRAYPEAPSDSGTLDPSDPLRPTLRLVGTDAVVVSVPSHNPDYRSVLDSLLNANQQALRARPLLLIDIRGNLGGGSLTTAPLVPYLVSRDQRPPIGPAGPSVVLSSPENIAYFRRGWNPDSVAERMTAGPGQIHRVLRAGTLGMPFPNTTVLERPAVVGVLMDRGVASAAEAFALQARMSTKVILYGQPTYGMIDYQSVSVVRLACRPRGLLLGYPMIAAAPTLPRDGLNATGIRPDLPIPPSEDHPVAWALADLRTRLGSGQ